jgi:hypothetical protein
MGGYGSGRWGWSKSDAKTLVESCWVLDINWLVQEGVVRPDQYRQGGVSWTRNEEKVASIGYEVNAQGDGGTLRLTYTVGRDGPEKIAQDYVVPLVTSRIVSGGRRWWFQCVACRRRVGKLYLPPGGKIFACRHCYDLAYTSSRESRKWDGMFKELAASTGFSFEQVKSEMMQDLRERKRRRT